MTEWSGQDIESSLRVSPTRFSAPLLAMAVGCGLVISVMPRPDEAMVASLLFILFFFLLLVIGGIQHKASGVLCVAIYSISIFLIAFFFRNPWLLVFMSFPTAISAIVVGQRGLAITTLGLGILLLAAHLLAGPGLPLGPAVAALVSVVGTAGLVHTLWRPFRASQTWLWESYERARVLLDEARNTQAMLREALAAQSQASRDLVLATERLDAMRLMAEDAQQAKSEFAANVSHEFRAPLNIIIGLSELLVDAPDTYGVEIPAEVQRDIGILYRNAQHMAGLVDDVLDLSQVEAGRLSLHREWTAIGEIVESACEVVQPLLDDKGLYLLHDIPENLPKTYCDPARVRQILLNLISNATRFTEAGGIRIGVRQEGPDTHFWVADTGTGISTDDLGRIFEPFEQAIRTSPRMRTGSGLGLSICKRFVEMHEGTMWVDSVLGEGSTFHFRLPTRPPSNVSAPAHRWIAEGWVRRRPPPSEPAFGRRKRMILHDRSAQLGPLLARFADAVETIPIQDVAELDRVTAASSPILAILNQNSPDLAVSAVLAATASTPDLPVFGCAIPAPEQKALDAGAVDQIVKPVSQADLLRVLDRLGGHVKRVMVIDDDQETLWLMKRKLKLADPSLDIRTSSDGAQALESLDRDPVDAILLDIVMPERDGWQILRALRARESTRGIPVVIVSARDPSPEPLSTPVLVVGMGRGLSVDRALRCIRALSELLIRSSQGRHGGHPAGSCREWAW